MSDIMDDRNYIEELRQQLAEAREEIRQLKANPIPDSYKAQYALILDERDTYRQELAEARALLDLVLADEENRTNLTLPEIRQQISAFLQKLSG